MGREVRPSSPEKPKATKEVVDTIQRLRRGFFEESGSSVSEEDIEDAKELEKEIGSLGKVINNLNILGREESILDTANRDKELAELKPIKEWLLQELNKLLSGELEALSGKKIEIEQGWASEAVREAWEIKNAIDKLKGHISK